MEGKSIFKSKTVIVGALSVIIGILTFIQGEVSAGSVLTIEGILMVALRLVTKEAIKGFEQ